jgi:hypothetical protein
MVVRYISDEVFKEVLVFVNYIQMTVLPLSLINTTPLNYRDEVVFLSSKLHSSCHLVNLQSYFHQGCLRILNLRVPVLNLVDFARWAKSLLQMLLFASFVDFKQSPKFVFTLKFLRPFCLFRAKSKFPPPLLNPASKLRHKILEKKSKSPPELLTLEHITPRTMKRSNLPPELSKTVYFNHWAVFDGGLLQ